MRRRSGRDGAGGFTLLEVLVTLVVLGFLFAGLAQGVQFGLTAWQTQVRTVDRNGDLDAVDRTLRRLVEQADPGVADDPPRLTGTARGVEFFTRLPQSVTTLPSRLASVTLDVDGAHRLVMRWIPAAHAEPLGKPPAPTETVLLGGVDHLDLAYWHAGPKAGWMTAWAEPEIPLLVRIRLVFPKGSGRRWPDIVAAPMRTRIDE